MDNHKKGGRYADHNAALDNRATVEDVSQMPFSCTKYDAAAILGISPEQASRLAKAGKIPAGKVGQQWRFPTKKLISMVCGD
jgi:excisionase family DNA binding protein